MLIITIIISSVVVGMATSFVTTVAVKQTSDIDFCSSCHSMKPMAASYLKSVHGGNNDSGVVTKCADCHLPHESLAGYLVQKAKTGMWDMWVEATHDTSKIDWHEKRHDRHNWVYDTGCLHCHENLLVGTRENNKASISHRAYFSKQFMIDGKNVKCVSCHKHVGHYELEKYLPKPHNEAL